MGNCLVTQLKGTVDNPPLAPLGYIRVPISIISSTSNSLVDVVYTTADNAKSVKVYNASGQYLSEITPSGATISVVRALLPDNSAFIDIAEDNIKNLVCYSRPTIAKLELVGNSLKYCNTLALLNITSNLQYSDRLSNILYNKPSLATLQLADCKCVGDCADFAVAPLLTSINVRYSANITGTLESLAKALFSNYVANKTITLNSDSFTLNGVKTVAADTTITVTQSNVVVSTTIVGITRTYTWDGTTGTYTGF